MNPTIKAAWCKALRSGDYKRGQGRLRRKREGVFYHCCLGVLAELYCEAKKIPWQAEVVNRDEELNCDVKKWAGLSTMHSVRAPQSAVLSFLNDTGTSFAEMADIIEGQL